MKIKKLQLFKKIKLPPIKTSGTFISFLPLEICINGSIVATSASDKMP